MNLNRKAGLISIIGGAANFLLSVMKVAAGLCAHSQALIAEGVHSFSDIVVSAITFIGIKKAEKPADEDHPFGHQKYESLASFIIALILIATGLFLIYESLKNLYLKENQAQFTLLGIGLMVASMIINELTARLKIYFGNKYQSPALLADGQHDRMDVLISLAVLVGLFLIKYFPLIDNVLSLLVGGYIVFESYSLALSATDILVDKSDSELKRKLEKFFQDNQIQFSEIKTRRQGWQNIVDLKITLPAKLTVEEASSFVKKMEENLKKEFPEIGQISTEISSHKLKETRIYPSAWNKGYRFQERLKRQVSQLPAPPSKKDNVWRCVIPLRAGEVSFRTLGEKTFLLVDVDKEKGEIVNSQEVINHFRQGNKGRGWRFIRWAQADQVVTGHIGPKAKEKLAQAGIKLVLLKNKKPLKEIIEKHCQKQK